MSKKDMIFALQILSREKSDIIQTSKLIAMTKF